MISTQIETFDRNLCKKLTLRRNPKYGQLKIWPKKSKPPPIFQKITLKIANEIRFLRKVKV